MITELTQEQLNSFKDIRDKWVEKAFKKKSDKEIINGIKWLYNFSKLKEPIVVILDNPYECQLAANLFASAQVRAQVDAQVRAKVYAKVGAKVYEQVSAQVNAQVGAQVNAQVYDQVSAQVNAQVGAQVNAQVRAQVNAQVGDQKLKCYYFSYDEVGWCAGWMVYFDFYKQNNLLKINWSNFDNYIEAISGVFMAIYLNGVAIISRPPKVNYENNKIHSIAESAIKFKGLEYYALEGKIIKKDLWQKIVNKTLPAKDALKIENTEIRALAVKYIGAEKILKELDAELIDKYEFAYGIDYLYELTKFKDGLGQPYRFLKGFDPAENDYVYIRVRPDCKSVIEAQTFCYRLGDLNLIYNPSSRT